MNPSSSSNVKTSAESSSSSPQSRSQIVASFWLVIILSLPVWWNTTKIERHSLPKSDIAHWESLQACPIKFPIKLTSSLPEVSSSSLKAEVASLEARLANGNHEYRETIDILTARCFDFHVESVSSSSSESRVILHRSHLDAHNHTRHVFQKDVSIPLTSQSKPKELLQLIAPLRSSSSSMQATDSRAIKYSSQLKLVFSLMNEDATQSGFIRDWNIKHAIELYLESELASLAPLHNFTCQTQISHHSPLTFEPAVVDGKHPTYVVEQEDLKAFINDADWNLASPVTMDPVLHFVLWIPSPKHRPFRIRRTDGTLDPDGSFIRPQWGSVVIYNPNPASHPSSRLGIVELGRPMQIFRFHLASLLGLVETLNTPELHTLSLDAIIRRRIVENSLETVNSLQAIVKLVDKQTNMRVSMEVQNQVKRSLSALKSAQEELSKPEGSLWAAGLYADESKTSSSTAFFSPTMVSLLYFPDEHKYAIYTPLFGPVLVPLLVTLIKELKALKNKKALKDKEKED